MVSQLHSFFIDSKYSILIFNLKVPKMLVLNFKGHSHTTIGSLYAQTCVTSTGSTLVWERTSQEFYKLHRFNKKGIHGGYVQAEFCKHNLNNYVLPISIQGIEYLTVSCDVCCNIRLINLQDSSQEPIIAYSGDGTKEVGPMCLGSNGIIYTRVNVGGKISILDCRTTQFKLKARLPVIGGMQAWHICYIDKADLIVVSSWHRNSIYAISSKGEIVWKRSGIVDNRKISPRGMLYIAGEDILVVGDYGNNRLLLLSGNNGN